MSSGDVALFDISELAMAGGDECVGTLAGATAAATDEINVLTGIGYLTQTAADTAVNALFTGTVDIVVLYFDTTTDTTKILYYAGPAAGASVLIGELTSITTQTEHDTLTIANIDSQA